jgi:hypothetical protein
MVSASLSYKIGRRKIVVIACYNLSAISKSFFAMLSNLIDASLDLETEWEKD